MTDEEPPLARAVREARERAEAGRRDPEPSLAKRFGQVGVLGWIVVLPTLGGVVLGHYVDRWLNSGITASAALTMIGAGLGMWLGIRWMHGQ